MRLPRVLALSAAVALAASLTACAPTITTKAGPYADDPLCAEVMVNLPSPLAGKDRVWTDAQSTAAWGQPTAIIMTCGVEAPAASTLPCTTVNGIDWLVDDSDEGYYWITSFGRSPAVQVFIDTTQYADSAEVLSRIAKTMTSFPRTGTCTDRPAA